MNTSLFFAPYRCWLRVRCRFAVAAAPGLAINLSFPTLLTLLLLPLLGLLPWDVSPTHTLVVHSIQHDSTISILYINGARELARQLL